MFLKINNNNNIKGVTLIELLIVVVIVGLLATIAFPNYQKYVQSTKATTEMSSLNSYKTAVMLCIQINISRDSCNDGSENIPKGFSSAGKKGVESVSIKNAIIKTKLTAINPESKERVFVELAAMSFEGIFEWQISCSDFKYGSIVEGCSKDIVLM